MRAGLGLRLGSSYWKVCLSPQFSTSYSHNFTFLGTKMSTDGDILLLDSLSSRVLNDFPDEVAELTYSAQQTP